MSRENEAQLSRAVTGAVRSRHIAADGREAAPVGLVASRLRVHRHGIEATALSVLLGSVEGSIDCDPELVAAARGLVDALVGCVLAGLEQGQEPPGTVAAHAEAFGRGAIRAGLDLSTVAARCDALTAALWDEILLAGRRDAPREVLFDFVRQTFSTLNPAGTAIGLALSECYVAEAARRRSTAEQRRLELVNLVLAGRHVDSGALGHQLTSVHLGVSAYGPAAIDAIRRVSATLSMQSLVLTHPDGLVWAWMSCRRGLSSAEVARELANGSVQEFTLALGEPGSGADGFRMTHRQARSALVVARLRVGQVVRYADVMLLAHAMQDTTLARSLIEVHLAPLIAPSDGSATLRETLRAYFKSGRNASAAAAVLDVDRSTVRSRLDTIERRLGRTLYAHQAELEVALELEQMEPLRRAVAAQDDQTAGGAA